MVRALLLSVCLLAAVGCGSGGGNPARSDCYYYVEHELCPTVIYCNATYASFDDCVNHFENSGNTVLDCATVSEEFAGLAQCEADTNYSSCGYVVDQSSGYATLPASCYGVFN